MKLNIGNKVPTPNISPHLLLSPLYFLMMISSLIPDFLSWGIWTSKEINEGGDNWSISVPKEVKNFFPQGLIAHHTASSSTPSADNHRNNIINTLLPQVISKDAIDKLLLGPTLDHYI